MRITRLSVEHFGCLRQVDLDLDADWVVVHGPNDIGKSTLARAIRMALLARTNSTVWDDFEPWEGVGKPQVCLEFRLPDDGATYRVTKSKAAALIQRRAAGSAMFHEEGRDRQVNERLFTKILRWGLGDPASHRGVGSSFIADLLFTEQDQVASILTTSKGVETDKHESAREWLTEVLEAKAIDPAFRDMLEEVVLRCGDYFTETGRQIRRSNSPIRVQQEQVEDTRKTLLALEERWTEMAGLRGEYNEKRRESDDAERRLIETRDRLERARARENRRLAHETAFNAWDLLDKTARQTATIQEQLRGLRMQGATHQARVDETQHVCDERGGALEKALEELRSIEADTADADRERQRGQLKEQIGGIRTAEADFSLQLARAEDVVARHKRLGEVVAKRDACRTESVRASEAFEEARVHLGLLRRRHQSAKIRQLQRQLEETGTAVETARTVRSAALSRLAEADEALNALGLQGEALPSVAMLRELGALRNELDIAEGQLAVGLDVQLSLETPRRVSTIVDDNPDQAAVNAEHRGSGKRSVTMVIEGVGRFVVRGGDPALHTTLNELRQRWQETSVGVFQRAGVSSLRELQAIVDAHDDAQRNTAEARAEALAAIPPEEALLRLEGELEALQSELASQEPSDESGAGEADDPERLEPEVRAAEQALAELERKSDIANAELRIAEANLADLSTGSGSGSLSEVEVDGAASLCARAQETRARFLADREALERELRNIDGAATAALDTAKAAVDAAGKALEEGNSAHIEALKARDELLAVANNVAGQLAVLEASFDPAELERRRQALHATPPPGDADNVDVDALTLEVERLEHTIKQLDAEVARLDGQLQSAMGPAAGEQLDELRQRLSVLEAKEARLLAEAGGWQLLSRVMKEVEATEAGNLGASVIPLVEPRLREITGPGYSLDLKPTLAGDGKLGTTAGRRKIETISVGTREQIATVFRLVLAERLRSTVVLDDQLVQSDSERMARLLDCLHDISKSAQILVFTCRPQEYEADGATLVDLTRAVRGDDAEWVVRSAEEAT